MTITKNRPTANDVHVPGPMGNERKRKPIQKPWTAANVPDNLKDWPENMRVRFAEVSSRVLEETGDEEKAIQAGIAAAMRLEKANYARSLCMTCKENPPDHDALWQSDADSLERAWLCAKCFPAWYAEKGEKVVHVNKVDGGLVPKRYRVRHTPKEKKVKVNKDTLLRVNSESVTLSDLALAWLSKAEKFTSAPWQSPESTLSAEDFAKVCLIDLNPPGEEKKKALLKLPIKSTPTGPVNLNALRNAAARLPQADAPQAARREAARKLVRLMRAAEIEPGEATLGLAGMDKGEAIEKSWEVEVIEKQEEKRIVYGVVLRPNVPDLQNDIYSPDEVEKAAHRFMMNSRRADWMHKETLPRDEAVPVESYIAMVDFSVNDRKIIKGDWIIGMYVANPEKWNAIKQGESQSFSVRGVGKRQKVS